MNTSGADDPSLRTTFDVVLVGGGLANCCVALALARYHPSLRVALVERDSRLGGNHTWCFHEADLGARGGSLLEPAVDQVWPEYEVRFPDRERCVSSAYGVITSERLNTVVQTACAELPSFELILGQTVTQIEPHRVMLEDGRVLNATWVVEACGPGVASSQDRRSAEVGPLYQKFLGLEVRLAEPSLRTVPLLMDAKVEQLDGFRFMYVLPFEPQRLLVEDTCFSDSPALDLDAARARILEYAKSQGFLVEEILRQEVGVLPMPCHGQAPAEAASPLRLGYASGWFHPTTGYSLPLAARVAEVFSLPLSAWGAQLDKLRHTQAQQFRFAAFLNRLLKQGFAPEHRWHAFSRFYGFDEALLARFFALKMTTPDRLRVLCGKPPRGLSLKHWQAGAHA